MIPQIEPNMDWLRQAAAIAKWECVQRTHPREWRIKVEFLGVVRGIPTRRFLGFQLQESTEPEGERRRDHNRRRFIQSSAALLARFEDLISDKTLGHEKFEYILPPNTNFIPRNESRVNALKKAGAIAFRRSYEVEPAPEPGMPHRWALINRKRRITVFYDMGGPAHMLSREQIEEKAGQAIEEMKKAEEEQNEQRRRR